MRSGERGRECGKEAAARGALNGGRGELVAAARLWRALKAAAQLWRAARRRQRGYGERGVGGGSATPEGGEEVAARLRYIGGEEVATRLRRAGRRWQRGCGGRGGGGSAAMASIWRAGRRL